MKTPTLDKMQSVKAQSQAIGEFIEWLQCEKGVHFGKPHKHDSNCPGWDWERGRYNPGWNGERCSFHANEFEPFTFTIERLLAEYFDIDLQKADKEKRALLEECRQMQAA